MMAEIAKISALMPQWMKNLILNIMHNVVTVLAWVVPKKENSILLYGSALFDDNSRALFQYLVNNGYNKKYEICCSAKNLDEFRDTNIENVTFSNNHLRVLWIHIRARYIFYSMANMYTNTPSKRQTIVNMWHGSILKKFGYMDNKNQWRQLSSMFTYLCVASEYFKPIMRECFGCDEKKMVINGNPRCDQMFLKDKNVENLFDGKAYSKVVVWMPTYRNASGGGEGYSHDSDQDFPIINQFNIDCLNEWLTLHNVLLIIKPHRLQIDLPLFKIKRSNIMVIQDTDLFRHHVEIYSLLGRSDALITDYSSVFYDYLLLDRPIGFTVDDIESYASNRGFAVPPEDMKTLMAGQKIRDLQEMFSFLQNVADGRDDYQEKRRIANELANDRKSGFSKYLLDTVRISLTDREPGGSV